MTARPRRKPAPNSQVFYADALVAAVAGSANWLDLGCGHGFLPEFLPRPPIDVGDRLTVGIDLDRDALRRHPQLKLRLIADIERLPIASERFDLVTANMVIEHVQQPERLFAEVARILKPGGMFLFHTPNRHGYTTMLARLVPPALRPSLANRLQDRDERDVYPTFYRANSMTLIRRLAEKASLDVADLRTVTSSAQLFKVPIVGSLEERLIALLKREPWWRFRPCILGQLTKAR